MTNPPPRITVCVESPYKGDDSFQYARNHAYALAAMMHAMDNGASPYLSHILIPLALDDRVIADRNVGLSCALAMGDALSERWFYVDYGMSTGMNLALERAKARKQSFKRVMLGESWVTEFVPRPTNIT